VTDDQYGALVEHYNSLLEQFGDSPKAVAWRDRPFQEFRFASVAQVFEHETVPISVYEVGCGLGHMRDFLGRYFPNASYAGCDINPKMIEQALRRDPAARVEVRNIVDVPPQEADYVVASGIFNLRMSTPPERWWETVKSVLSAMYATARKGIAANFLTSFVDWRREIAYHQEPAEALRFAQTELSRYAEIRHAYYPWEFTLMVYREPKALAKYPAAPP
jgi:SAM-dependent methyltransferase